MRFRRLSFSLAAWEGGRGRCISALVPESSVAALNHPLVPQRDTPLSLLRNVTPPSPFSGAQRGSDPVSGSATRGAGVPPILLSPRRRPSHPIMMVYLLIPPPYQEIIMSSIMYFQMIPHM